MLKNEQITLAIPRNGFYEQDWQFTARATDGKSWEPIDLTGHVLSMKFRYAAGQGPILASADFNIYDPTNGWVTVTVNGGDFYFVQGVTEIVTLAYDLKDTQPDGVAKIYPRGHAMLIPGVS